MSATNNSSKTFGNRLALTGILVIVVTIVPFSLALGKQYAQASNSLMRSQEKVNDQLANTLQVFGAINNGPGGVILFDRNHDIVYVTDGVERLTGWSQTEIVENKKRVVLIPDVVKNYIENSSRLNAGSRLRLGASSGVRVENKSGKFIPVVAEAWLYDWQNERRAALFLRPISETVESDTYLPKNLVEEKDESKVPLGPAIDVLDF